MKKRGFTLAEVLITLAIIGVVAAISIPSVISNTQQQEFKTGLRKAVSVLNSAITMNMAIDGESPYDNANLYGYLMKHMAIISSFTRLEDRFYTQIPETGENHHNSAFYTTDGMRFEFPTGGTQKFTMHEKTTPQTITFNQRKSDSSYIGECGSFGLASNVNSTNYGPCLIMVDVNGDRKPTPSKVYDNIDDATSNVNQGSKIEEYWIPNLETKRVSDIFVILITEDRAIPYGIVAQKAMYGAQK